jgi:hypothetical protein
MLESLGLGGRRMNGWVVTIHGAARTLERYDCFNSFSIDKLIKVGDWKRLPWFGAFVARMMSTEQGAK